MVAPMCFELRTRKSLVVTDGLASGASESSSLLAGSGRALGSLAYVTEKIWLALRRVHFRLWGFRVQNCVRRAKEVAKLRVTAGATATRRAAAKAVRWRSIVACGWVRMDGNAVDG